VNDFSYALTLERQKVNRGSKGLMTWGEVCDVGSLIDNRPGDAVCGTFLKSVQPWTRSWRCGGRVHGRNRCNGLAGIAWLRSNSTS
jgi:hypothetical protein